MVMEVEDRIILEIPGLGSRDTGIPGYLRIPGYRDPAFLFRDPTVYRNLVLDTIKMKVSTKLRNYQTKIQGIRILYYFQNLITSYIPNRLITID